MASRLVSSVFSYLVIIYLLVIAILCGFASQVDEWSLVTAYIILGTIIIYPFSLLLPTIILGSLSMLLVPKKTNKTLKNGIVYSVFFLSSVITLLILIFDFALLYTFGFHINPLVVNLLTTPGGFDSMGLRSETIITASALIFAFVLFVGSLLFGCIKFSKSEYLLWCLKGKKKYFLILSYLVLAVTIKVVYAYEHFTMNSSPLMAVDHMPGFLPITMRGIFLKMGLEQPSRDDVMILNKGKQGSSLEYPLFPIKRDNERKKYNIVWLACESLRWDVLNEEIMPESMKFAAKATNFKNNYSGGNGTRHGMFTMFYGLYGSYWDSFLKSRRGPLVLDWMIEDGYQFKCLTSAQFSYPEFDRTIFANIPSKNLYEYYFGRTWERDRHNVELLTKYIREIDKSKPFMTFMFFESPHAPYEFPQESIIRDDYLEFMNYAILNKSDAPKIFNRYVNACHHLDSQLKKVFDVLTEQNLWKDTIVILAGDHGEEFYEKGRLGHNSTFVQEQVRTPLVIYIPGKEPMIYKGMSSHMDVVPMLAPYFGVKNKSSEFSTGHNLLDEKIKREFTVVSDWGDLFFIGKDYKTFLPSNILAAAKQKITDLDDNALPENHIKLFYNKHNKELIQIQQETVKFLKR